MLASPRMQQNMQQRHGNPMMQLRPPGRSPQSGLRPNIQNLNTQQMRGMPNRFGQFPQQK